MLIFNGIKVKMQHSRKQNISWFVWNKGCSSAPSRTSLVTEHLSSINKFMENLKLLALYSVAGNSGRIKERPTLHSGLSEQQAVSFLDMNQHHKSGTISKETVKWSEPAFLCLVCLTNSDLYYHQKEIHHDVSAGMDLLICRFLEWIRKCLRHCLTPYFGLHLVWTNWVQYIFPCYYSVLCLPLQHRCKTGLF